MEKLELKHLAPYLPYELFCQYQGQCETSGKFKMIGIDYGWVSLEFAASQVLEDVIPILHPLSDLTKEIEIDGEPINPIEEIYNDSWMALGYRVIDSGSVVTIISRENDSHLDIYLEKPQVNMWWVTQRLISMHFDVFGLIENGLAVDINKLK